MRTSPLPLVLVAIAGPQAAGKSTIAAALSDELRRYGEQVALVELDQIAQMALPTLPTWEAAHAIFGSVVGQWARAELTCVIAEGPGTRAEVNDLLAQVPDDAVVLTVVLTAPFEVAYARARADTTRGFSREYEFLSGVYERWLNEIAQMDPDVLIHTEQRSVEQSVELIRAAIDGGRIAHSASL